MNAIVNELSNTIDLQSTLIRAESLFHRFQRTVEAIDKRSNFPAPSVRQRKPTPASPTDSSAHGAASGADVAIQSQQPSTGDSAENHKVISPELRSLLSRKVEKLDDAEVKQHGGGVS